MNKLDIVKMNTFVNSLTEKQQNFLLGYPPEKISDLLVLVKRKNGLGGPLPKKAINPLISMLSHYSKSTVTDSEDSSISDKTFDVDSINDTMRKLRHSSEGVVAFYEFITGLLTDLIQSNEAFKKAWESVEDRSEEERLSTVLSLGVLTVIDVYGNSLLKSEIEAINYFALRELQKAKKEMETKESESLRQL